SLGLPRFLRRWNRLLRRHGGAQRLPRRQAQLVAQLLDLRGLIRNAREERLLGVNAGADEERRGLRAAAGDARLHEIVQPLDRLVAEAHHHHVIAWLPLGGEEWGEQVLQVRQGGKWKGVDARFHYA